MQFKFGRQRCAGSERRLSYTGRGKEDNQPETVPAYGNWRLSSGLLNCPYSRRKATWEGHSDQEDGTPGFHSLLQIQDLTWRNLTFSLFLPHLTTHIFFAWITSTPWTHEPLLPGASTVCLSYDSIFHGFISLLSHLREGQHFSCSPLWLQCLDVCLAQSRYLVTI